MSGSILIIEDQKELSNLIKHKLEEREHSDQQAFNGEEGLTLALSHNFSLIILDIILPRKSGIEILETVRRSRVLTPILILSTRNSVENIVEGLSRGADDYLPKPFKMQELLERVVSILRRTEGCFSNKVIFKDLTIDLSNKLIKRGDSNILLSATCFKIFTYLLQNINDIVPRNKIVQSVWLGKCPPSNGAIDVHINTIRKRLSPEDRERYIRTVHGIGFIVEDPV